MKAAAVLVSSLALAACSGGDHHPARVPASALTDRNWLDVWPTDKDDHLHVYRFTPSMGGGVYQDRTVFKGTFELFTYSVHGDELEFVLPDQGEIVKTHVTIEKVSGPAPFDLRLTLDHSPRGPRVYFGRSAESLFANGDADSVGSWALPQVSPR
jgi:hypothetical protein